MKLKKYPKQDLNRKKGIYFLLGLLAILMLTYFILEWKFDDDNGGYDLEELRTEQITKKDSAVILETKAK